MGIQVVPPPADVLTCKYTTSGAVFVPPTGTLAADDFNRLDSSSSLGVTPVGGLIWQALQGIWGTIGGQAYCSAYVPGSASGDMLAVVDVLNSDVTVQFTVAALDFPNPQLIVRASSNGDYVALNANGNMYVYSGGALIASASGSSVWHVGAVVSVVASGSTVLGYLDGVLGVGITTSFNIANTKHGLSVVTNGIGSRFDDFSVTSP